jgi:IS30 family transposase
MAACSSSAASGKKRKRVVLTIEDKLKICDLVKNGRSMTSAAAEFNVGKSTVHDIVKNQAKLQTFLTEIQDGDCIKKRRIVRRANLEALDKAVYLWFVQQRCITSLIRTFHLSEPLQSQHVRISDSLLYYYI